MKNESKPADSAAALTAHYAGHTTNNGHSVHRDGTYRFSAPHKLYGFRHVDEYVAACGEWIYLGTVG